ncbi:BON domain-containing protein [bacterium]|nr:BON domain-containing protein [bacterium]MCI0603321.1 BON domain-containing protein [bacterium]
MARKFALLVMIFLAVSFMACSASNDARITTEVKAKITDDEILDATDISVDTKEGVVTLEGKITQQDQEAHAIQLARSVPQVKDVVSRLQVEPQIGSTNLDEKMEETAENAGKKLEETAEKTGEKIDGAGEKIAETADKAEDKIDDVNVGEMVDDASTTAKVKLALAKDDQVAAYRIDVDTKNGVVTLTGKVKNAAEAAQAVKVAESIEGVKKVNSDLVVGS